MNIEPRRTLEYGQSKFLYDGYDVVEHFGLKRFVVYPCRVGGEEVKLNGEPLRGWLKLSYQYNHLLVHLRMIL